MKNKNLIVDYVISGFGASFRLGSPHIDYAEGITKELFKSTAYLESLTRDKNIEMSGLFNAFTEERLAKRVDELGCDFKNLFGGGMYVDSGGLQVMTQKKDINEKMRNNIYQTQAKYGDYAMSFDVIPSEFINGQKIYFPDRVGNSGTEAGKNLLEQIKCFKKLDTKCKVMPIIQGLGESDMDLYSNNMFSQLSDDELEYITSVAFGGGTGGFEFLNRMMHAHNSKILSQKMKHVHMLGVTGFQRLMPPIIAALNGILPDVNKISFDSTTLSKTYVLGLVWPEAHEVVKGKYRAGFYDMLGKVRNKKVEDHYEKMWNFWKNNPDNIFDDVEDLIDHSVYNKNGYTTGFQQFSNLTLEDGIKTITQKHVFVYYNTFNFINVLKMYLNGNISLQKILGEKQKNIFLFEELEKIDNYTDYQEWQKSLKKYTKLVVPSVSSDNQSTNILF